VLLQVLPDEALPEEFKPQRTAVLVRFNRLRRPSELSHVPAVDAISVLGPVLIFSINLNNLKCDSESAVLERLLVAIQTNTLLALSLYIYMPQ
jgi:hypothetical protein